MRLPIIIIIIISIKIVHEVHTKGSKHDTNKKVMKYTKTQWKKDKKDTVYKRLEQNSRDKHINIIPS